MTQKERIIELVKQNIITMDEALQLLEASSQQTDEEAIIKQEELLELYEKAVESKNDSDATKDSSKETTIKIEEIISSRDKKREALLIAKQRLRELEILAELDDLTPEMNQQAEDLRGKIIKLEDEIVSLEESLNDMNQESYRAKQESFKKFADEAAQQVKRAAEDFTKQATKEGRSLQKTISEGLKNFSDHFEDISINMTVPWIKSRNFNHTFVFKADNIHNLDFKILNGSVEVMSYDGEDIIIEGEITYYGREEADLVSTFLNLNTIDQVDDQLIFHTSHPKTAIDIEVKVPNKMYDKLSIFTTNGDTSISEVEAGKIVLDSKNGDIRVEKSKISLWEVSSLNGDIKILDGQGQDIDVNLLNGDYRFRGSIQTMSADTVNGDILLTLEDSPQAKLNVSSARGDIKVAVGQDTNLSIKATSKMGDVKQRLSNLSDLGGGQFERTQNTSDQRLILEAKTGMGDIYLKD